MNPINPRKIDPENLYTLNQVAEFLNVGYATARKMKDNGSFGVGVSKVGKRYYISGQAIHDYIKENYNIK